MKIRMVTFWDRPHMTAILVLSAIVAGAGFVQRTFAQQPRAAAGAAQDLDKAQITVVPIQGNIYMLAGGGSNITVQIGPSQHPRRPASFMEEGEYGVLLVDTAVAQVSEKVRAAIRTISPEPIRYIINTSADSDHVGGNENLTKLSGAGGRAGRVATHIVAHEAVMSRLMKGVGEQPPAPEAVWPTEQYLDIKEWWFDDESLQVFHIPAAHTDGDSIVYFRRSDVVSAGEIFSTVTYPIVDLSRGGSINGVIEGLNKILDLTITSNNEEGGTKVIPGHGRICDEADVVEYRNTVVIIRDRIQDLVKRGMTLEQVKAAKPTLDYDRRYSTASWPTEKFVEAVYTDLAKTAPKAPAAAASRSKSQTLKP